MLDPRNTVARIVLDHSECAPVFQRHRVDFCCRGDMTVEAACAERQVDVRALVRELEQAIAERRGDPAEDPRALSTPALVALVISRHHEYLRKALPFVKPLAEKVARVHGDREPRLRELETIVGALAGALEPHLDAEEQTLFPALMSKVRDDGVIARELRAMHEDHLTVGDLLQRMRTVTDDYRAPDWACNSYRALLAELSAMEADVLRHVHLENHVLMPRFTAS
jgi:regulator of cell morphogenesis and NO signaling